MAEGSRQGMISGNNKYLSWLLFLLSVLCIVPIRRWIYIGDISSRDSLHTLLPWIPVAVLWVFWVAEMTKVWWSGFWNRLLGSRVWTYVFSTVFTVLVLAGLSQDILEASVNNTIGEYRGAFFGALVFVLVFEGLRNRVSAPRPWVIAALSAGFFVGFWEALFQPGFIAVNTFPEPYWVSLQYTWVHLQLPYIASFGVMLLVFRVKRELYRPDWKPVLWLLSGYLACTGVWYAMGYWIEIIFDPQTALASHGFTYNYPWDAGTMFQLFLARLSKLLMALAIVRLVVPMFTDRESGS